MTQATADHLLARIKVLAPRAEIGSAMACLAGHDLAALVGESRAEDARRRAARKAEWTKAQSAA